MVASSPYAVVGGMWRSADATLDGLLAQRRIGKIASLMPKMTVSDLDAWDADLLPPLDVQHAAVIKALHACSVNGVRLGVPIVIDASGDDDRSVRWFDDVAGLVAAREASAGGCYALGLAASAGLRVGDDTTWEQHIVLPFPGSVLRSPNIWLTLGRAAARLTVELLSRSGARLHEASLLDAARLRSFEPIEGAPTRFTGTRRYGWDADVLVRPAKPVERDHTTKDSNQGG
jgi:hypothetical protein